MYSYCPPVKSFGAPFPLIQFSPHRVIWSHLQITPATLLVYNPAATTSSPVAVSTEAVSAAAATPAEQSPAATGSRVQLTVSQQPAVGRQPLRGLLHLLLYSSYSLFPFSLSTLPLHSPSLFSLSILPLHSLSLFCLFILTLRHSSYVNAVYVYVKCSSIINASELHHTLTCVL